MFLVPIVLIIRVLDLVQLIGWVASSIICIDTVLNSIIIKLQYSHSILKNL